MIDKNTVKKGQIYLIDFDPSIGNEFRGRRPGLVIQSDHIIKKSNLISVIPFTSNLRNKFYNDILVKKTAANKLWADSILKVRCIMSLDICRFLKKMGMIEKETQFDVDAYLREHFGMAT